MSEFARRIGVTPQSVHKAIKNHRIGVVHDDKGHTKIDWETASIQWTRSSRPRADVLCKNSAEAAEPVIEHVDNDIDGTEENEEDQEPELPEGTDYIEQRGAHEAYKAKLARLEYLEKKGQLMRRDDAVYSCAKMVAAIKQRVLSIPSKAKVLLPHLSLSDMDTLETLVRDTLCDLAEWSLKDER